MTPHDKYKERYKNRGFFINPNEDTSRFLDFNYGKFLESELDYYKRHAVAADKYIMVKARNEMIVDTGRQLTDEEHDQQYQAFTEYTSILQEREAPHE